MNPSAYAIHSVGGHPHWKAIPIRTFDGTPEQQANGLWIKRASSKGVSDDVCPGIHETVLGVPLRSFEPYPALLVNPAPPGSAPEPGQARVVTLEGDTAWLAVPQDWFFHHFTLEPQ
jgi:hypothetical protein